jgi:hypothetical protein
MTEAVQTALQKESSVQVGPKIYLNGFPKSGLHLLNLWAVCMGTQMLEKNWLGTFKRHSWSNEWADTDRVVKVFENMGSGNFMKGHMGYRPELAEALKSNEIATVFLFRDIRDVIVSQAHHIMNDNDERFMHPGKDLYRELDSFEDVIIHVIIGLGPYPGIFERWALYEPWRHVPWVCQMSYEYMYLYPEDASKHFIQHVLMQTAWFKDYEVEINQEDVQNISDLMVSTMDKTEYSATYRKGGVGGWKNEFTPKVAAAFDGEKREAEEQGLWLPMFEQKD